MKYIVIDTKEDLEAVCTYFRDNKLPLGFDTETTELDHRKGRLRLVQMSDGKKTIILDVFHLLKNEGREDYPREKNFDIFLPLKNLLEDIEVRIIMHYAQFDSKWVKAYFDAEPNAVFDTMIVSQEINYNLGRHNLANVARNYINIDLDKTEQKSDWSKWILDKEQYDYAALDVFYLPKLREVMFQYLEDDKLLPTARVDLEVIPSIVSMNMKGLCVDPERYKIEIVKLKELYEESSENLQNILRQTKPNLGVQQSMFGLSEKNYSDVLLSSHKQVLEALKAMGLPVVASTEEQKILEYKKKGVPFAIGTGRDALEPLVGTYPFVKLLFDFRGVEKMLTAFGENFLEHLVQDENGYWRVHSDFSILGAPTGRFASRNPNVQQIPDKKITVGDKEYDLGFREAFVFPEGYVGINADYSQIELRILAEFSGCPIFTDAFINNKDLHAATAAAIWNVPHEDCENEDHPFYKKYRKPAKNVNFGIAYGQTAIGLAAKLGITVDEAQAIIQKHMDAHPVLWDYLGRAAKSAMRTFRARTALGRLQKFEKPNLDDFGKPIRSELNAIGRNGRNMPIQGCLAGDSRILVNGEGYVKIGETEKTRREVWDGDTNVGAFITISGKKVLTKVRFDGNSEIECSPEHKFWAIRKGGDFEWVEAQNLTSSHKVLLTNKVPSFDFIKRNEFNILKKTGSEGLGILAAVFYMFGSVDGSKLIFTVPESDYLLKTDLRQIFLSWGLTFYEESLYDSKTRIKTKFIVESNELLEDIKKLDCSNGFTESFWRSKPLIRNFLRALFNFSEMSKEMFQIKGNNQLLKDIQQALFLFGVRSKRTKGLLRDKLYISKRDAYRFILNIGIIEEQKALKALDFKKLKEFRMPNKYNQLKLQVQEVEVTKELVEMYDVTDSETSQFVANGLITHNTSADILKKALKSLHDKLKGKEAWIVNIVHDEITVECKKEIAEEVRPIVEKCMRDAGEEFLTRIPVKVDAKIIKTWGDK